MLGALAIRVGLRCTEIPSNLIDACNRTFWWLTHLVWDGPRRSRTENLPKNQPFRHPIHRCVLFESLHLSRIHDSVRFSFNNVRMASRYSLCRCAGKLDCYNHRLPSLLLRNEEARNFTLRPSLEGPIPALCRLDVIHYFLYPPALW